MIDLVRKTSPQLLLILVLLFLGVGFSLYKAVDAFSPKEQSPEYQRSPSAQTNPPVSSTLFDFKSVDSATTLRIEYDGARFPDQALFDVGDGTRKVIESIEKGAFTGKVLNRLGYQRADADRIASRIQRAFQAEQSQSTDDPPEVSIDSVGDSIKDFENSGLELQSKAIFTFYAGSSGNAQKSVSMTWKPDPNGEKWLLRVVGGSFIS